MSLKNARVLVVGGTSGIGLGVAAAVAERDAVPIVVSRRQSSVDRALDRLPATSVGATVDLADPVALDRLVADTGEIDHLVFTAGEPMEMVGLDALTAEVVGQAFQTRYVGALLTARAFRHHLKPGGSITLTSGTAAERPGLGVLPSSICNAVNALTKALAVELAPLRVNAVAPGPIHTPMWDTLGQDGLQTLLAQVAQQLPLGRVGEVADAAAAYVYLMEQEFGTGVVLTVDGGTLLA